MFITQNDNFYGINTLEPTQLLICHVPMEAWVVEQKWIDGLSIDKKNLPEGFFKLPVKKIISRFLSLLDLYIKESVYPPCFFELKRQELFFLLFNSYQSHELIGFLQYFLSKDMQFKIFVMDNYPFAKNVQELAKFANYSTSGFIKKFQKCFNDSPYKWMQNQKAKRISFEINRGIKSLQEISNEYKFSSYQHFSVFCKTQLGSPPTEILLKNRIKKSLDISKGKNI
jgi:AraC-like DNA-binding protein